MTHDLPGALQQALGIGNISATKETDIDVSFEDVDISERCVAYTRGRMAVVQYFSYVVAAVAHNLKPMLRDRSQFTRMITHPVVDSRISLERVGEAKEVAHQKDHVAKPSPLNLRTDFAPKRNSLRSFGPLLTRIVIS